MVSQSRAVAASVHIYPLFTHLTFTFSILKTEIRFNMVLATDTKGGMNTRLAT